MAKTHVTLSIDVDLREEAKQANINLSEALSEYLRFILAKNTQDIDKINYEIEVRQLEKLIIKQKKMSMDIQKKQTMLQEYIMSKENEQIKLLQAEKQQLELKTTCKECGQIKAREEGTLWKIGFICHSCFKERATGDKIKKWMEE
jgi:hypothetical protein